MDRQESPNTLPGAEDGRVRDSELAQGIWRRYGGSPGVIPLGLTGRLAGGVSRMGAGRLPLLADVQQRWLPAGASYPGVLSALRYVQPITITGAPAAPADSARPAPGQNGMRGAAPSRLAATAGKARVSTRIQPSSAVPQEGGDLNSGRVALPGPARPEDRKTGIGRRDTGSQASAYRGAAPPGPASEARQPTAVGSGDVGPAIVQRRVASPKATQPEGEMTTNIRQSASSPIPMDEDLASPGLTPGAQWPVSKRSDALPVAASGRDLGPTVVQRHLEGPARPVAPRVPDPAGLEFSEGHKAAEGQGLPPPHPAAGMTPPVSRAMALLPAVSGARHLATAIIRRHLDTPVSLSVQSGSPAHDLARHASGRPGDRVVEGFRPHLGGVGPTNERPSPVFAVTATVVAGSAAGQIDARPPGWDLSGQLIGEPPLAAGSLAMVQRWQDQGPSSTARDEEQTVEQAVASQGADGLAKSASRTPVPAAGAAQQPAMPLFRAAMRGERPGTWAGRFLGASRGLPRDILSRKVVGHEIGGAEASSTTLLQAQSAGYGAGPSMPVQRAAAESPTAGPVTMPASAEEPSTAPPPDLEDLDLEHLASEVIAIIERRLVVERESLGL